MKNKVTTTDEKTIELLPVSQVLVQKAALAIEKQFREAGEPIDPPIYYGFPDTKEEPIKWDAGSVEKDGNEEDKKLWAKHIEAKTRLEQKQQERATEIMLLKGIKPEYQKVPDEWIDEQKWLGIELPDNERDLKIQYISTEIFKTPADLISAISAITILSLDGAVQEEDIEAVEGIFRSAMGQAGQQVKDVLKQTVSGNKDKRTGMVDDN